MAVMFDNSTISISFYKNDQIINGERPQNRYFFW